MRRFFRAVRATTIEEWRFLAALVPLALCVHLLTRMLGFNRAVRCLPPARTPPDAAAGQAPQGYRRMIGWAQRFAPLINCLSVSTAAWWLLRRRGIAVQMKFGVARCEAQLLAHAWLECQGRPVTNEPGLRGRYTAFDASIL